MPEVWYAVVVDGVVASVVRRFEVACERAKEARLGGSQVVVRRATPDEVRQGDEPDPAPWIDDGAIPF